MRRIVVAPDKFKGTLSAHAAARAMRAGALRVFPQSNVLLCPVADGGDGTIEALVAASGGEIITVPATDPLGRPISGPLGILPDGRAVVELAAVSGLNLLRPDEVDACRASSRGTGEVLREALTRARHVIVGIGGSASTDGGTGAARAVGWRFLDRRGRETAEGGCSLVHLASIHDEDVMAEVRTASVMVASDVTNPLLGSSGAARVYGPQKGASAGEVRLLEEGLAVLADVINRDLGLRVADLPGAGAAGGAGAGLIAFFGAEIMEGFELIAHETGLARVLAAADLVLTGEGRLDGQTLAGKAPAGVARMARHYRTRCLAIAGEVDADPGELAAVGISDSISMVDRLGRERAVTDPAAALTDTVEWALRRLGGSDSLT